MKKIFFLIVLIITSYPVYSQSTCMSRCEEVLRVGDSRCPDMCRVHPDGLKKPRQKKTNVDASTASKTTELSSSAPQAQQTQTLKPQATEKKPPETATASSAQASKEK